MSSGDDQPARYGQGSRSAVELYRCPEKPDLLRVDGSLGVAAAPAPVSARPGHQCYFAAHGRAGFRHHGARPGLCAPPLHQRGRDAPRDCHRRRRHAASPQPGDLGSSGTTALRIGLETLRRVGSEPHHAMGTSATAGGRDDLLACRAQLIASIRSSSRRRRRRWRR